MDFKDDFEEILEKRAYLENKLIWKETIYEAKQKELLDLKQEIEDMKAKIQNERATAVLSFDLVQVDAKIAQLKEANSLYLTS